MGEISLAIVEALPMTEPEKYIAEIDRHPLRGCWARWIDKKYLLYIKVPNGDAWPAECRTAGMPNHWTDNHITLPTDD